MKKLNIASYMVRTKWLVLILIAIVLIIFGRTVKTPTLSKMAIILGIGIDYAEDSREFSVTAQTVLVGSSTSNSSAQNMFIAYTDSGRTVAEALDGIGRKMGLNIWLSHCNVLFLSPNTFRLDLLQLLAPLTGMYALPEQSIVVSGELPPEEMLTLRLGTTTSAPFFIQSTLVNQEGSNGMIRTTAKDLLARSLSRSRSNAIPYIQVKKMEKPPLTQETEIKDSYEFILSKAIVFNSDSYHIIDDKLSEVLALYLSADVTGTLNYTADSGESVEFKILRNDISWDINGHSIGVELKLPSDLLDVQFVDTSDVLTGADTLVKNAAQKLSKQIEDALNELFELSKRYDIDFLNLQAKAYQSVGYTLESDCLNKITFTPSVTIEVREAA